MIDAHCHVADSSSQAIICPLNWNNGDFKPPEGARALFFGCHPWYVDSYDEEHLRQMLEENPGAGVGEIGLDRLKSKEISARSRVVFSSQLQIAALMKRPVVLHGAKCWGEVVNEAKRYAQAIPAFLFHGFSRSGG